MTRVKGGNVSRKRHKKVLKLSKGFRGAGSLLFRTANQQVMKALNYSYVGRKQKKRIGWVRGLTSPYSFALFLPTFIARGLFLDYRQFLLKRRRSFQTFTISAFSGLASTPRLQSEFTYECFVELLVASIGCHRNLNMVCERIASLRTLSHT